MHLIGPNESLFICTGALAPRNVVSILFVENIGLVLVQAREELVATSVIRHHILFLDLTLRSGDLFLHVVHHVFLIFFAGFELLVR